MKRPVIVMLALVAVGIASLTGASAYAYGMGGKFFGNEDIANALENNDYQGFKAAVSEMAANRVTEEDFTRMAERFQEINAISGALESGDYNAWKAAVEAATPPSITEIITEENFGRYVEMQNALKNGDYETASAIAEELGLDGRGMMGFGRMKGFGHGMRGGFRGNCPMQPTTESEPEQ